MFCSAEAQASVRVSPHPWLTEGESVTLICEVSGSSTGWTFSWFRDHDHLSDSSRGAGGSYTLSPAALQHTGVYTCRAERGRPAYYTHNSSSQTLWLTGEGFCLCSSASVFHCSLCAVSSDGDFPLFRSFCFSVSGHQSQQKSTLLISLSLSEL